MKEALSILSEKHGRKVSPQTFYGVLYSDKKKADKEKAKAQAQIGGVAIPQIKHKKRAKPQRRFHQPPIDPAIELEILKRQNRKFKDIMMRLLMD